MTSPAYFPSELRTLSFVPRWSIVATVNKDQVASHSYYVTLYAYLVAKLIKWEGSKTYLMLAALTHDLDETITGDIVSPVKKEIIDQERCDSFVDTLMLDRFGSIVDDLVVLEEKMKIKYFEEASAIIKVADRMDALFFLIWEQRMGNTIVEPLRRRAQSLLEGAWRALPADEESLSRTWQVYVLNSIKDHENEGGRGV